MVMYTIRADRPSPLKPDELRAFRERAGWSAHDLAVALGTTYGAVWRWESGKRKIPGPVCAAVGMWRAALEEKQP